MRFSDGGFAIRQETGSISLVLFGRIEHDLEEALANSLAGFFSSIQDHIRILPAVVCWYEEDPRNLPPQDQQEVFFSALTQVNGNIRLGVTNTGFYDPSRSRHLFSYGQVDGRGVLSTYRFRKETATRRQFLERMGKQVLKTLALACTVDSCSDPKCIISYHRWTEDLDRNRYVCESCRKDFARNLSFFLNVPDGSRGSSLKQKENDHDF